MGREIVGKFILATKANKKNGVSRIAGKFL